MKRTPLKRTGKRARYATRSQVPEDVRDDVWRRCGGRCERCGRPAAHLHHRLMRSQGGGHTADNLAALCGPCHRRVHDFPAESYAAGWLIRSTIREVTP